MNYKLSRYNYNFQVNEENIGIYNTFTQALAILHLDEYSLLKQNYNLLPIEIQHSCIENGFLVPKERRETVLLDQARINGIQHSKTAIYRILTTSACNASCFYCYENRCQSVSMDRKTATQVVRFIQAHSENSLIQIQWFGGEPLLNSDIIDYITMLLRQQVDSSHLRFSITTNGSLINEELIHKMIDDWSISKIQITLDGTAQEYAKRKKYIHLKDPYETVLRNILWTIQSGIRTVIRLNYDYNNYQDILQLIEQLGNTLPHAENLRVYAYHLYSNDPRRINDQHRKEEWFAIQNALTLHGFTTLEKSYSLWTRRTRCFACQTNGFVVAPEGTLFKCPMATMDINAKVGDVWNGITNNDVMACWCNTELEDRCCNCIFLPICQGGCRAGELGYSSESCFPQKNFIDDILQQRIRIRESDI